jgi:hypothetical protein
VYVSQSSKEILLKEELGYQGAMGSAKRSARDEFMGERSQNILSKK